MRVRAREHDLVSPQSVALERRVANEVRQVAADAAKIKRHQHRLLARGVLSGSRLSDYSPLARMEEGEQRFSVR